VDAHHFHEQLHDEIAREQVVFADHIIINKMDLVSAEEVTGLIARIRTLNPTAAIDIARHGAVDVKAVFGIRHFSLDTLLSVEPDLLDEDAHDHEHDNSIASHSFIIPRPLDAMRFNRWANQLVQTHGQQLLRMKGVLNLHEERRRLHFHSVHMLLDSSFGKAWAQDEPRDGKFVMIGRDLDMPAMREGLLGCMT